MRTIDQLIAEIEQDVELTQHWTGRSQLAPEVLEAIAQVPRECFVPESEHDFAYRNAPLSIGCGQTISQPFIVALMTDLLDPRPDSVILEVGTGSGYQAAVLSLLVKQVYSVEILPKLAMRATELLSRLNYRNIDVRACDGNLGWPEHAPYDGIIVTAAANEIPPRLIEQLKVNANLVIPVGQRRSHQELVVVHKNALGETTMRNVLSVAFVPLTGGNAQDSEA